MVAGVIALGAMLIAAGTALVLRRRARLGAE